jgi:integrase/recombinase XerC
MSKKYELTLGDDNIRLAAYSPNAPIGHQKLVEAFLSRRSPSTRKTYRFNLRHFADHLGARSIEDGIRMFLALGHAQANLAVLDYQSALVAAGTAPATVNNRIAAIRSVVRLARLLGMVEWTVEIEGLRLRAYRDTAGPGLPSVKRLIQVASRQPGIIGARDTAMIRLLFDLGLRRIEVSRLDIGDIDLEAGRILVQGKGKLEKDPVSLPSPTCEALAAWIGLRGACPGPCFVPFTKAALAARKPARLSPEAVSAIIGRYSRKIGARFTPHGLRHTAITAALDLTGGNIRSAARFSRHAQVNTLQRYDDNRQDIAGDVARMVAEAAETQGESPCAW